MGIREYINRKRQEKELKEKEYRQKVRKEAEAAKQEISELKELEKNKKVLNELAELKQKHKKPSKTLKAVNDLFSGIQKGARDLQEAATKIDKQYMGGSTKKPRSMFESSDMFKEFVPTNIRGEKNVRKRRKRK